jgi:sugar phosphate permease
MIKNLTKIYTFTPWLICGLGALFYCYDFFLRISPSVMMHELMQAYDLTGAQVGSLSAFYYHAYVPMQIIVGLLMDRYRPRRLLIMACMLCAFGTYLFAGSHTLLAAQVGRFLVGFGSAFGFVGALKLATVWLPANRFALVSGIITCLGMVGAMIGDILLRALIDGLGWQTTTYLSAAVGIVLTVMIWAVVRDANPLQVNPHEYRLDFRGLLAGLWGTLTNVQIWLNGLVGALLYLSLSAFAELWGIPYLEQAHGFSSVHAAHANSMVFLGWAIGGPFWGWFSDFIERRCLPIVLSSVGSFVLVSLLLYMPHLSVLQVHVLLFLFGFFSSVQILVFAICREVTHIKIAGTAIALTNMIVMLGGNLFQPLIGKFLDMGWAGEMLKGTRVYALHNYQWALGIIPLGMLLVVIAMVFIRETHGEIPVKE